MEEDGAGEAVEYGVAARPRAGESKLGDAHVLRCHLAGVVTAVIDGLGHGREAARAAEMAAEVVTSSSSLDPVELIRDCHVKLRGSRGAAMTIVSISTASGTVSSIGVGNVQGMLVHGYGGDDEPRKDFVLLRGGVVGHLLPALRPSIMRAAPGDTLVLATDGVSIEFTTERRFDLAPQPLAEQILSRHATVADDALVLVLRFARRSSGGAAA